MEVENLFVKELDEFKRIYDYINCIFNIGKALPEQVFNDKFSNFMFEEFDWTMSGEFWDEIKTLAVKFNDNQIYMLVLDPDQVNYFCKEFNYFNCIKLPISLEKKEYIEALESAPEGSPADAILYNSFTVVWTSPSMRWGIWGQRDYGISIIAFNKDLDSNDFLPYLNTWKSVDDAINGWMTLEFKDKIVPQKFKEPFCKNYSYNT